jgi:lysophospholipid acyltransferase (LPLAT)-like uncharacterized protein
MEKDSGEVARRLDEIACLVVQSSPLTPHSSKELGRNLWTRSLDRVLGSVRRYARPLHWAWVATFAVSFYVYARLCALTARLKTVGAFQWPDFPQPSVLAVWHGCVNSLIVAVVARRPRAPLAVMIAGDSRGDCLALLCRLLGIRVARVTEEGGWAALGRLAAEINRGASVIITADGGGPARIAKAGAVALSLATATPILAVGTSCSPAISMPHKWDAARTPLPFGREVVAVNESRQCADFTDPASIESSRLWLQQSLDEAAAMASRAL